jgi:hypothetical protein
VTVAPLASRPRWRCRLLRPASACNSGVGRVALVLCQRHCAKGPWVLDVLGWRAECSGELNDGWAEEMLSLQS